MTRADRWAVLFLCLAPVLLMLDAVRPAHVAVTWDTALQLPWLDTATPEEVGSPRWNEDAVRENLSYRVFLHDTLSRGEIPWWAPHIYGGVPFMAMSHVQVLYPLTWASLLLTPETAYGALLIVHMTLAGLGMFAFLRVWGRATGPALVGATIFMLNGMFASRTGHPQFVATGAWLPWTLLGVEGVLRARHRLLGVVIVALGTALAVLAGHPSIYVYGYYFVGAWLLYRLFIDAPFTWTQRAEALGAFVVGFGLGVGLASPQLLATLELSQFSDRAESSAKAAASRLPHWSHLLRAVFPNATGSHRLGNYWSASATSYTAGTLYAGVATLLLAGWGAVKTGRRGRALAALLVGFVLLMYVPALFKIAHTVLPGFKFSRVDRLSISWYLGLAALAALGTEHLLGQRDRSGPTSGPHSGRRVLLGLLSLGALVVTTTAIAMPLLAEWDGEGAAKTFSLKTDLLPVLAWGGALWAGGSAWVAAAHSTAPRGRLVVALLALLVVDLGWFVRYHLVVRDTDRVLRSTPATDFLQADEEPFRIAKFGGHQATAPTWTVFPANVGLAFGLEDLHGFGPLHPRTIDILLDPLEPGRGHSAWHVRPFMRPKALSSPTLDVARVKYLLTAIEIQLEGWRKVHGSDLFVYENLDVLPPAWLVTELQLAEDMHAAARALHTGEIDPRRQALVERLPEGFVPHVKTEPNPVEVVQRRLNEVVLRKQGPDAGLLVLPDLWYPGWRATVDGEPAPIHLTNAVFRGVVVGEGDHEVRFAYHPTWWVRGWTGATLSLLVLLGLLAAARLRARREA